MSKQKRNDDGTVRNTQLFIIVTCIIVKGKKKKQVISKEGPLLITHYGLSGPAVLRLSAFAARELNEMNYQSSGAIKINFVPSIGSVEEVEKLLWKCTSSSPKRLVSSSCPLLLFDGTTAIPKRLWKALVLHSGLLNDNNNSRTDVLPWSQVSKKKVRALAQTLCSFEFQLTGKGTFKEEFVTAGGISLQSIQMKTMESKLCPQCYFCGEILNIDGVTGGYNFMNCWSTGYIAGTSAALNILSQYNHNHLPTQ